MNVFKVNIKDIWTALFPGFLTVPAPCISESCIKMKSKQKVLFSFFFVVLQNVLWRPLRSWKKCENKNNYINSFISYTYLLEYLAVEIIHCTTILHQKEILIKSNKKINKSHCYKNIFFRSSFHATFFKKPLLVAKFCE